MQNKADELSQEMYHRIYRMIKRNIEPKLIAATLNLPLKTITNIVFRIKQRDSQNSSPVVTSSDESEQTVSDFLDAYQITKTRYAVIQLVGVLHSQNIYMLEKEMEKSIAASWKAVAIRMTDLHLIDIDSCKFILTSHEKFLGLGRYLAILDPSPEIEPTLNQFNMEDTVPIFGTERAFEDAAFSKKSTFLKT